MYKGSKRRSSKSKKGPRRARKAEISDGDDTLGDNSSEASYCTILLSLIFVYRMEFDETK